HLPIAEVDEDRCARKREERGEPAPGEEQRRGEQQRGLRGEEREGRRGACRVAGGETGKYRMDELKAVGERETGSKEQHGRGHSYPAAAHRTAVLAHPRIPHRRRP